MITVILHRFMKSSKCIMFVSLRNHNMLKGTNINMKMWCSVIVIDFLYVKVMFWVVNFTITLHSYLLQATQDQVIHSYASKLCCTHKTPSWRYWCLRNRNTLINNLVSRCVSLYEWNINRSRISTDCNNMF